MSQRPQPPRIRSQLLRVPGYEPVEPLETLARRLGMEPRDVLKLDANENPFGPSPTVAAALARFDGYAVYPDPAQTRIREAIAAYAGAPAERIVAGAGSDELIDLTLRCLAGTGEHVINCPPTFGMYGFLGEVLGVPVVEVERDARFGVDVEAVRAAVTPQTAAIVLASPNNPTGNGLSDAEIDALLGSGATVVLDEAYSEFAGRSYVRRALEHPRLIVLRTFSKWAGLAGLRAGYGVFPENVAATLLKVKQPYNVNRAAEVAVLASLADIGLLEERVQAIVGARGRLFEAFEALSWLEPYPSEANFLLCRVRGGDGRALKEALAREGVFVRHFETERLRECVRISVPRPDQEATLLERLHKAGASLGLA